MKPMPQNVLFFSAYETFNILFPAVFIKKKTVQIENLVTYFRQNSIYYSWVQNMHLYRILPTVLIKRLEVLIFTFDA